MAMASREISSAAGNLTELNQTSRVIMVEYSEAHTPGYLAVKQGCGTEI